MADGAALVRGKPEETRSETTALALTRGGMGSRSRWRQAPAVCPRRDGHSQHDGGAGVRAAGRASAAGVCQPCVTLLGPHARAHPTTHSDSCRNDQGLCWGCWRTRSGLRSIVTPSARKLSCRRRTRSWPSNRGSISPVLRPHPARSAASRLVLGSKPRPCLHTPTGEMLWSASRLASAAAYYGAGNGEEPPRVAGTQGE